MNNVKLLTNIHEIQKGSWQRHQSINSDVDADVNWIQISILFVTKILLQ